MLFSDVYTLEPDWQGSRSRSTSSTNDIGIEKDHSGADAPPPPLTVHHMLAAAKGLTTARASPLTHRQHQWSSSSSNGGALPPHLVPPSFPSVQYETGSITGIGTGSGTMLSSVGAGSQEGEGDDVGSTRKALSVSPPSLHPVSHQRSVMGGGAEPHHPSSTMVLLHGGAHYQVELPSSQRYHHSFLHGAPNVNVSSPEERFTRPVYLTSGAIAAPPLSAVNVNDPWSKEEWKRIAKPAVPPATNNLGLRKKFVAVKDDNREPRGSVMSEAAAGLLQQEVRTEDVVVRDSLDPPTLSTDALSLKRKTSLKRQESQDNGGEEGENGVMAVVSSDANVPSTLLLFQPPSPRSTPVKPSGALRKSKSRTPNATASTTAASGGSSPHGAAPASRMTPKKMAMLQPSLRQGSPLSPRPVNQTGDIAPSHEKHEKGPKRKFSKVPLGEEQVDPSLVVLLSSSSSSVSSISSSLSSTFSPSATTRKRNSTTGGGGNTNSTATHNPSSNNHARSSVVQKHQQHQKEGVQNKVVHQSVAPQEQEGNGVARTAHTNPPKSKERPQKSKTRGASTEEVAAAKSSSSTRGGGTVMVNASDANTEAGDAVALPQAKSLSSVLLTNIFAPAHHTARMKTTTVSPSPKKPPAAESPDPRYESPQSTPVAHAKRGDSLSLDERATIPAMTVAADSQRGDHEPAQQASVAEGTGMRADVSEDKRSPRDSQSSAQTTSAPMVSSVSPQTVLLDGMMSVSMSVSMEAAGEVRAPSAPDPASSVLHRQQQQQQQQQGPLFLLSSWSSPTPSPTPPPIPAPVSPPVQEGQMLLRASSASSAIPSRTEENVPSAVASISSNRSSSAVKERPSQQQQPLTRQAVGSPPASLESSLVQQRTPPLSPSHPSAVPVRLFSSPPPVSSGVASRPLASSSSSTSPSPSPAAGREEWAESIWQQAEEQKALYRQEVDKAFEARCEQLTAWMLTQARHQQQHQQQQQQPSQPSTCPSSSSQPRPSRSVGTETEDAPLANVPQEKGRKEEPSRTAVDTQKKESSLDSSQQHHTRLKYWEAQSRAWEEKFKTGEQQWQEERETLHQRCAEALLRLESQLQRARSTAEDQSRAIEELKRESEQMKDAARLELAEAIQTEREMVRKEEAARWQAQLEEQRQWFEDQRLALVQRQHEELIRVTASQTQREQELQRIQEQRISHAEGLLQERIAAQERAAAAERDAHQKELQRLQEALEHEKKKGQEVAAGHQVALDSLRRALTQEWEGKLTAFQQEHSEVVLAYETAVKHAEQEQMQLKSEKTMLETTLQTTKKALQAREWKVAEAFDTWQQRASEAQRQQLEQERETQEALVRERCEALLAEYFEKVAQEEAARHERLQEDHRAFYAELSQIQAKERERNEKRRRELEQQTMEQIRQMAEESQQREAAQRVRLAQREETVAEKERAYVHRLASAEAEAVERGRALVEAELLKARVDIQQRYKALRTAQQGWDESSAAWERETASNYAARFEKAKSELAAENQRLITSLLAQLEDREEILMQERASLLQHWIQSFHRRSHVVAKASQQDLEALQEAQEVLWQEREAALLHNILSSREAVVNALEERSRAMLVEQAELLTASHKLAAQEAQERLTALQESIRESMKGALEARQDFEGRLLQRMEAAMKEEQQRMTQLLEAQREVYRGGMETLQQRWRESEKARAEALETSRQEERQAWETSVSELEEQYLHQYQELKKTTLERVRQMEQQQQRMLQQVREEQAQRVAEVEETNDIQTQELRQMYERRLEEMEVDRQKRVASLHQQWRDAEAEHLAQRGALQHRLEEAYQRSLSQLRDTLEEREKAALLQQRGEQLYVEDRIKTLEADLVARYDAFSQQLAQHSHEALEHHRGILLGQQQELEAQLVAIREQLSVALVNHLTKVESQELQMQSQQAEHMETEMQQLALLLSERERRKAAERQLEEVLARETASVRLSKPITTASSPLSATTMTVQHDPSSGDHSNNAVSRRGVEAKPVLGTNSPPRSHSGIGQMVAMEPCTSATNSTSGGTSHHLSGSEDQVHHASPDNSVAVQKKMEGVEQRETSQSAEKTFTKTTTRAAAGATASSIGTSPIAPREFQPSTPPPHHVGVTMDRSAGGSARESHNNNSSSSADASVAYISERFSSPKVLAYSRTLSACSSVSKGSKNSSMTSPPPKTTATPAAVASPMSSSRQAVIRSPRTSTPPALPLRMEVLYPKLEELWDLLEVPEAEQAQVQHQLRVLAMITPVEVSRARQLDIVHWEMKRLASYIPLLELVAQRQVLIEELDQLEGHQRDDDNADDSHSTTSVEDGTYLSAAGIRTGETTTAAAVSSLREELAIVHSDLVRGIRENEKFYRKPLTFRGEKVMDLILPVTSSDQKEKS